MVSVGTAKMIHCRRRWWWWCVHDLRLKIIMHRCDVWTCMSAANACWIVLCKCMLDIKCSVLRGWSCAITKSFEFWLRTDEKMGLTLNHMIARPPLFDCCNQTMIDGWEGHGGLCNPLAQGATAKSKDQAPTKHSDNPAILYQQDY